jgi:hypothetical protein
MMPKQTTPEARVGRTKRTPINGRNVLNVSGKEAGFTYRIVNDVGDRVKTFEDNGWELVGADAVRVGDRRVSAPGPLGSKAQVSVNKDGTKAFVMRIKDEWYREDQAEKARAIAEQELSMKQQALSEQDYGKLEIGSK